MTQPVLSASVQISERFLGLPDRGLSAHHGDQMLNVVRRQFGFLA